MMSNPTIRAAYSAVPDVGERVMRFVLAVAMGIAALVPIYGSRDEPVTALYMNLAWAWFTISEPMRGPGAAFGAYAFRLAIVGFLLSLPILVLFNILLAFWAPRALRLFYFLLLTLLGLVNLGAASFLLLTMSARYGSFGLGSIEDPIVIIVAWIVELVLLVRWTRQSVPSSSP